MTKSQYLLLAPWLQCKSENSQSNCLFKLLLSYSASLSLSLTHFLSLSLSALPCPVSFTLSRAEKIGCLTLAYLYTHLPPERRGLWGGGGGGEGWARGETGQVSSSALGRRLELVALLEGGVWEEGEGWVLLNFPGLMSPLPVFHSLLIYSFPLSFSTKVRFDLYPRQVTTGRPSAPETNPPNPHPTTTEWIPMCPSTCV